MYAMDESGFPPAIQGWDRVVGQWGTKTQQKQGDGDHENITALVTICVDGSSLPFLIIFKGHNFMTKWCDNNILNAVYIAFMI